MYHGTESPRVARRQVESLPGTNPEDAARRVLARVRKALTAFRPGLPFDPDALRSALSVAFAQPEAEAERLFALGWLSWLDGAFVDAEPSLVKAVDLARQANASAQLAEAAYWLARVRLRLERGDAVSGFETVLRQLGGSPQATAWFVDLLWRSGRVDRADQVWKSVRGNKRVTGCAEGPLLEARSLLRRGEICNAIKVLAEYQPASGVVFAERLLLLAWAETAQGGRDRALEFLKRAEESPYPRGALVAWRNTLSDSAASTEPVPAVLRDLDRGYRAPAGARPADAVEAFRAALAQPAAAPFARYALARLGHDSFAEVLAVAPGLFLAVRCRVWLALERFRQRQGTPAEWLEALQREVRLGYVVGPDVDHFRRLALTLTEPPTSPRLSHLVDELEYSDPAQFRNIVRASVEVVRRLPVAEAKLLLLVWARSDRLAGEDELRGIIDKMALRLALQDAAAEPGAAELLSADLALRPAAALWQAAAAMADDADWRERVRGLRSSPRLRPLAQALLLHEAARRGDVAAVAGLLDEADVWRSVRPGPPPFVLRTLQWLCAAQPAHVALRSALTRWLAIWDLPALDSAGAALAATVGITPGPASGAEPPPGVALVPWLLHQAARAVNRNDFVEALACVRRAQRTDPDLAVVPDAAVVRDALPELERRALAQAIAVALQEGAPEAAAPDLLTDLVDLLRLQPDGDATLGAASRGDGAAVRAGLNGLLAQASLPPRLAHHLALLALRAARAMDDNDDIAAAEAHWRRAWAAWLRFLVAPPDQDGPSSPATASLLLETLLAFHRTKITDLLARGAVDGARRHWAIVQELPALAAERSESLGDELGQRVVRFRDELASDYLVTTREAMRYGDVPEGWRADYDKGLAHLRRLLSLDPQNVRLLTALVEVCGDWFLDLYNTENRERLTELVGRFTPFAQQLARLVEDRPGDLAARAALSEFLKFRGFVAAEPVDRVAHYREALRFNAQNQNVRELLKGLGESMDG
jgi:tetratricopeptide (TPR) repeat protein